MEQVQNSVLSAPIAGTAQSFGVDKDALVTRLDALLEQYLYTLDEYEKLMRQLSKKLSSGYFSLTQANFHNRSGVHYGQDSYDERVQATLRTVVTEDEKAKPHFKAVSAPSAASSGVKEASQVSSADEGEQKENPDVPDAESDVAPEEPESENEDASKVTLPDPIRMFGILVPPALRSARTSFNEAVEGPVVDLATIAGELRALEREIGRVRKGIRKAK
ncbi:hypothetical protein G6514_004757 [Epicoccum nigrum]|nr:hypothetical protein G6514_004757 [Epicoccum nigrum]